MKTVIEMAREAQMLFYWCTEGIPYLDRLERFAELVRADEREACAKACEDDSFVDQWKGLAEAAKRIRARSNTK